LIVGMEKTPGWYEDELHNVSKELGVIQDSLKGAMSVDILINPTRDAVLSKLKDCTISHFACHGRSFEDDPSKSGLLLKDWKRSLLNFRDLSKLRLTQCRLAFLSACETAENKNIELSNENIHLAVGFQLAGVPTVIGTLWKIYDEESADVVEMFYEYLREGNNEIHLNRSAEALHHAIRNLRDRSLRPLNWAAYVYFGA
jgi:CHAT domain-containing protein